MLTYSYFLQIHKITSSNMSVKLTYNEHGKGRVRIVKLRRNPNGVHDVLQMNVEVLLQGDCMETAFTEGDNSLVVPTDTCKNTIYYLGKTNNFGKLCIII